MVHGIVHGIVMAEPDAATLKERALEYVAHLSVHEPFLLVTLFVKQNRTSDFQAAVIELGAGGVAGNKGLDGEPMTERDATTLLDGFGNDDYDAMVLRAFQNPRDGLIVPHIDLVFWTYYGDMASKHLWKGARILAGASARLPQPILVRLHDMLINEHRLFVHYPRNCRNYTKNVLYPLVVLNIKHQELWPLETTHKLVFNASDALFSRGYHAFGHWRDVLEAIQYLPELRPYLDVDDCSMLMYRICRSYNEMLAKIVAEAGVGEERALNADLHHFHDVFQTLLKGPGNLNLKRASIYWNKIRLGVWANGILRLYHREVCEHMYAPGNHGAIRAIEEVTRLANGEWGVV